MTTGRAWRFRRCPKCGHVDAASKFTVAQSYRPGWQPGGTMRRCCPECGYQAETARFTVVREQHTEARP